MRNPGAAAPIVPHGNADQASKHEVDGDSAEKVKATATSGA